MLADFMDRADVGVVQCRRGTRLSTKSFERLRIMRDTFGQEFQRYETTKFGVLGFVDYTHPATPQLLDYAVMRDGLPHELGGRAHWRECYDANDGGSMLALG